jgi:O-glycosyl hydrolase
MWRMAGCALALGLASAAAGAAAQTCPIAPSDAVSVRIAPDWRHPGKPFEGWGTALAWFGHVTGGLPEPVRTDLADKLYGDEGLRLNIARYNIGGGNAADTPAYLRPGADVPGFLTEKGWDGSADAGQRWWLDAVRDRVPEKTRIFEAFSNSPPSFMTVSGRVSGNEDGLQDNLKPGEEGAFADYLARVVQTLEQSHHIRFRTLSPVNEPNTPYWFAANTQEGAHWTPARQAAMIKAVKAALTARGLKTEIAAPDETNAQTFVLDWAGLDTQARADIGQLNAHSYDTTGKTAVRDIARASGKRLWMSEVDLSPPNVRQDYADIRPAIALSEQIISDINRLEPQAWVLWQAVENDKGPGPHSSNWGLIKLDYATGAEPHVTEKYWAMGAFTRFIRPGARFISPGDSDTVVAVRPGGHGFVAVHVNPGLYARRLAVQLPKGIRHMAVTVTDAETHWQTVCRGRAGDVVAPPLSVTTVEFD